MDFSVEGGNVNEKQKKKSCQPLKNIAPRLAHWCEAIR